MDQHGNYMCCLIIAKSSKLVCYTGFQKSNPDDQKKNTHGAIAICKAISYFDFFHKWVDIWSFSIDIVGKIWLMFDVSEILGKGICKLTFITAVYVIKYISMWQRQLQVTYTGEGVINQNIHGIVFIWLKPFLSI